MLRRPLLYVAAAFAAAIILGFYAGHITDFAFAVLSVPALCILKIQESEKKKLYVLMLVGFLAGAGSLLICDISSDGLMDGVTGEEETVAVSGRILSTARKTGSDNETHIQLTVHPEALNQKIISSHKNILISCYEGSYDSSLKNEMEELMKEAVPGRRIDARGVIQVPKGRRNPGGFNYQLYLKSLNITTVMSVNRIYVLPASEKGGGIFLRSYWAMKAHVFFLREQFMDSMEEGAGKDTAAMMRAILFGDKDEISDDVLQEFQRNGTAHILAVSGLHIGIIYGFLLALWEVMGWFAGKLAVLFKGEYVGGRRGWRFFAFTGLFFLAYMILADFSPSVVRAVIMVMMHCFAQLSGRRYDLNSAAFVMMLCILTVRPYMLFNSGFQMSFLAVLTMTMLIPYVRRIHRGILISGVAVQIGLGPFILYHYNYLSLCVILVNIPVIAIAGLIVPMGILDMVLASFEDVGVLGCLFDFFAKATGGLCEILQWVNGICEVEGLTTFLVASPPLWMVLFYYLSLLVLASEEGRRRVIRSRHKFRYVLRVSAALVIASCLFSNYIDEGFESADLVFVDVGQGDCMHIRTSRFHYLIDGGGNEDYEVGSKTLKPYLLKAGITHIDGAFATHLHTDHFKGICELAKEGMIDRLYLYEGNRLRKQEILQETGLREEQLIWLRAGQKLKLGREKSSFFQRLIDLFSGRDDEVTMDVLWPERKTEAEYEKMLENESDENAISLIFRVNFGKPGVSMIATGDMDKEGEENLVQAYDGEAGSRPSSMLHAEILKVAHHGSKNSSCEEFLQAVAPKVAVIQVGKNTYGHPTKEAMNRIEDQGAVIYRNDLQGALGIEIRRGVLHSIHAMIN